MSTLAAIRTRVQALVANHAMISSTDATGIIQAEHESILEDYSWSRRKAESIITTIATYSTGTITTVGTALTGTGTVFTIAMVGRYLRGGNNTAYVKITACGSATTLTLEAALQDDLTDSTYTIQQQVYTLPSDFGRVLSLAGVVSLVEITRPALDDLDPRRSILGADATHYVMRGLDADGNFELEVWPVPVAMKLYRLNYLKTNTLTVDGDSPIYRATVLVWKAAESCAFFLHGRTGDGAWLQLADRYHQRYLEDLQGAKEDDLGRSSPLFHVRDAMEQGYGSDFWLDRDPLRLL